MAGWKRGSFHFTGKRGSLHKFGEVGFCCECGAAWVGVGCVGCAGCAKVQSLTSTESCIAATRGTFLLSSRARRWTYEDLYTRASRADVHPTPKAPSTSHCTGRFLTSFAQSAVTTHSRDTGTGKHGGGGLPTSGVSSLRVCCDRGARFRCASVTRGLKWFTPRGHRLRLCRATHAQANKAEPAAPSLERAPWAEYAWRQRWRRSPVDTCARTWTWSRRRPWWPRSWAEAAELHSHSDY